MVLTGEQRSALKTIRNDFRSNSISHMSVVQWSSYERRLGIGRGTIGKENCSVTLLELLC